MSEVYAPRGWGKVAETTGAWLLALIWIAPLAYAVWTAFHPSEFSTRFELFAPLTLDNFSGPGRRRPSRAISSTPSCW
jgi:sn-glycerol 3-phosphate transport system permease protein